MTTRIKTADGRHHPDPIILLPLILSRGNMVTHWLGPPGTRGRPFRGEVG